MGAQVFKSQTVDAAIEATLDGIPAIAFSGASGSLKAWNMYTQTYHKVYAQLATTITQKVLAAGPPYLPDGIWLNVNFPKVNKMRCASADSFEFVL